VWPRPAAIAAALLAVALAAGCGRDARSTTPAAAPQGSSTLDPRSSEAERNAERDLEGAQDNAAGATQPTTSRTPRPPAAARPTAARPRIVQRPIPFGPKRRAEMRAYARRHYGIDDYRLRDPKVMVEHYTVSDDFQSAYDTFANDVPDAELHELPGTCAHFVVDNDGTIYQLVALTIM
jgi:N-acetylmuramoyl-L-alanine amidase